MHKTKVSFIVLSILLVGTLGSVSAQKLVRLPPEPIDALRGTYVSAVDGNELSAGESEFAVSKNFGWTSSGQTSGDLTGFLFLSVTYVIPNAGMNGLGGTSAVSGGTWAKLIFKKGQYLGSVYGNIIGGDITWSETDLNARMTLKLSGDNGTGSFVLSRGKGLFEGTLDRMSRDTPRVTGKLTLTY